MIIWIKPHSSLVTIWNLTMGIPKTRRPTLPDCMSNTVQHVIHCCYYSVLGSMHHVDVANVANVSKVYSVFVFRTLQREAVYASETSTILPTTMWCKERSNNKIKINMGFLANFLLYPYYRFVSRKELIHTYLRGHIIVFNLIKIKKSCNIKSNHVLFFRRSRAPKLGGRKTMFRQVEGT